MPELNIASLLLYQGLGLVALAIGLLARRYSPTAIVMGLFGLFALTTASTWITAAGSKTVTAERDTLGTENIVLKQTIARQQAELDDARKSAPTTMPPAAEPKAQSSSADLERLEEALRAEQRKRAEAESIAEEANKTAAAAIARVSELDRTVREARDSRAEAERKAAFVEERLRDVRPAPSPPAPPDPMSILRRLTEGDRSHYVTSDERDVISGMKGTWYVIRLLKGGKDWTFPDRQFVLADAAEIRASAVRLRDDVLLPLTKAGRPWRLFVRGTADLRRIAGPVGREILYLPSLPDGTHSPKPTGRLVAVAIKNEELPPLRADWLREVVRPVLGVETTSDIEILENTPQPGHSRTAELVLFVAW